MTYPEGLRAARPQPGPAEQLASGHGETPKTLDGALRALASWCGAEPADRKTSPRGAGEPGTSRQRGVRQITDNSAGGQSEISDVASSVSMVKAVNTWLIWLASPCRMACKRDVMTPRLLVMMPILARTDKLPARFRPPGARHRGNMDWAQVAGFRVWSGAAAVWLMSLADPDLFYGYDVTPVKAYAAKVQALYKSIQPPGEDPMLDFDERDLVRHAQDAGFAEVNLDLRVTVKTRKEPMPWELFMRTSGNPLIPAFGEALDSVLSPEEAAEFTEHLRPLVESGTGRLRRALAYLTAVKEWSNADRRPTILQLDQNRGL